MVDALFLNTLLLNSPFSRGFRACSFSHVSICSWSTSASIFCPHRRCSFLMFLGVSLLFFLSSAIRILYFVCSFNALSADSAFVNRMKAIFVLSRWFSCKKRYSSCPNLWNSLMRVVSHSSVDLFDLEGNSTIIL